MERNELRNGMWVRLGKHTGIAVVTRTGGIEFHKVDAAGLTVSIVPDVDPAELTQATLADIPTSRRPGEEVAQQLGYLQA